MKEFVVYTLLRLALFLATWGMLVAAWVIVSGKASLGLTFLLAFVISGIGSYFVLRGPREAFARRVEVRAARATERFEEMRSKEDVD